MDPATGKIDFSIVMTGMSGDARKQRAERAQGLKALIKEKGKVTLKFDKLFEAYRERSDVVSLLSKPVYDTVEMLKNLNCTFQ